MTKRVLSFVLALLMVVGMLPAPAHAADTLEEAMAEVNIYAKDQKLNWLTMNGSVKEQEYTYYNYRSAQTGETKEIPAYCVDPRLYGVPAMTSEGTPIKYTAESTVNDPKICGIISNGYPHMGLDTLGLQTKEEAYYATKTAVWIYLLGNWTISGLGVNPNLSGADKQTAQRVLTATKAIYQRGMYWNELYSPKLTATADTSKATPVTINGEEYYQQVFTIDSNTWALTPIRVSLAEGAPAGAVVMNMDDDEISQIILSTERTAGAGYQGKVKVVYPKSAIEGETGTCQLKLDASVVEYKIYYAKTLEADKYGNLQHYMLDTDPSTPISTTAISSYSSDPDIPDDPGDPPPEPEDSALTIYKYEAGTRKPLAGAIFDVWYPNGEKYGSFATDETGTISLPINIFGNYTVTERIPPKYHLLPEISTQHVTVTATTPGVLTFWNAPYGNLRVHKISNTGDNLEGVSITIKNLETGETQTGKTGAGGVIEFTELKPGGYEVKETAGIKGYILDVEATKTATVVTGETSEVTFVNKEKPGLKIVKFDRKTLKTMSDISFEIWRDGESLGTYTTDQMGEIVMPDLEPGTYLIKEVQSDDGHIADPTPQQVELHAGDGVKQVLFYNDQKPGMRLIKVDSENLSKVIPNVKFEIKSVAGDYGPEEFTTDANGEIDLSKLPTGAYVVTEIMAPEGYLIDNASRIIQLDGNETAEFVFTNTKKPTMEIVKYDPSTGRYLAGATFRIVKIEDGSHYLDRVTDTQGRITIDNLEPGIYSVQETAAPSGYVLNDTEYHVELFPGKTSELVVNNEKKPDLKIIKTDAITCAPIAGATFTVRKIDSSTLLTKTTDRNGEIFLAEMDPGVYEITEQSVPDAYLLDPRPQKITLTPDKLGVVQFQNYPKPTLTVKKIDSATGKPVEGARFHFIYGSNHTFTGEINDLGEFYTDANGIIKLEKLKDGWYQATEVEAPAGYRIKDSGIQECYIAAGRDKVLTFENVPLSTILIQKMDAETGKPLSGAWFRMKYLNSMTSMDGTTLGEYPTDDNGQIEINGLDEGTYIIDEISAPGGYVMNAANTRTVYLSGENQDFVTITYGNQKMGSLLIVKKDALTGAPLANVEFFVTDSDGAVIGNGNGKFTTDYAGSILINNLEPGKTVVAKETRTVSGYVLDDAPQPVKIKANETVTLEFRNAPKGTLIVQKIDSATGEPLSGAEFKITAVNGELTADNEGLTSSNGIYQADRNGQVVLEKLTPGAYVVTETKAPDGYVLEAQPQTVAVNAGDTQTLTFGNPPKGSLTIHKLDSLTGKSLEGCQFKITYADGKVVDDGKLSSNGLYVTDKNGQIILSGITGTLIVTEEKTIPGYEIDPETRSQTVVLNPDDAQALTFYNRPKGTLIVQKYDKATGLPLSGAEFKIVTSSGELLADNEGLTSTNGLYVTDENGQIVLTKLSPATYVVTETKAPEGYQLDPTPQTVVVNTTDTQTLIFRDEPLATLTIIKRDVDTKELLAGAAFTVKDGAGNLIGDEKQYVTGADGTVTLTGLAPNATVVVSEEVPPAGYWNGSDLQTTVLKSGAVNSVTFENRKLGTLIIRKFVEGTNNQPLKGVAFRVTSSDGTEIGPDGGVYYTDAKGEIVLRDIQPDIIVKAREIKTVDGYILDGTPQDVKIIGGQTQQLTFWNAPKQTLTVQKYVEGTTTPIEGVTFLITDSSGAVLGTNNGEFITDRNGRIVLTGLTPGTTVTAKEVKTVSGYILNSKAQSILIKAGEAQTLTFYNERRGGLRIEKRDSITGAALSGAEFKITTIDGAYVDDNDGMTSTKGVYRTDGNGEIFLANLAPNTYVVREIKAPEGYILDGEEQSVKVNANDTQTLTFTNTAKQNVIIQKYIDGTTKTLAGVTFLVTDGAGNPIGSANGEHVTDENGRIVLTGLTPGTTLLVREVKTVKGYTLNGTPQAIVVGAEAGSTATPSLPILKSITVNSAKTLSSSTISTGTGNTLTFYDEPLSTLIVHKYIEGTKNEPLSGVAFKVTDGNGGAVGPNDGIWYTNAEGEIIITDLEQGTVLTVREVKTVNGFVLNGTPKQVTIKSSDVHELTFWNARQGALTIRKLDSATQKPLEGVTFKVTDATGAYVPDKNGKISSNGLYKTDAAGEIVLTGVTGTLVVTEVETIPGYTIRETTRSQTVVVNPDDVQTLTFYNDPTQALTINKFIANTTTPIEGVTFLVTSSDGTVVGSNNGEFVTDRNGQIKITGLVPGTTITAKEVKTVSGFVLNPTPQSILIKAGEAQTLNFYNQRKGALIVEKRDSVTGAPLSGAEFKITTLDGAYVDDNEGQTSTKGIYKTDEGGKITLNNLLPDSYVVTETKAPEGYILDSEAQTVKVNANDTQTISFTNTAKQSVVIQKFIDGTTKPLSGVTFLVTDASGAPVGSANGEHVTDENGRIVLTGLTPGMTLTAREVKTVKGYTLNGNPQTIVVGAGAASQTVTAAPSASCGTAATGNTLTFYDNSLSVLIIQKYVEGTTTPIKGVRFLVTDNHGAPVGTTDGEYVTDEHGQIVLRDLEPGTVITAKEVRAADGYVSDSTPKSITIKSGDVQTLTFYNRPTGTLILIKRDRATDKPLSGAKFQITDSTGAYVGNDGGKQTSNGEYITGEDGTIRITGLQPCTLVIREVKAPDGYMLNTQPLTVEIKASDTQTVNSYNDATQALTIQKYVTGTTNPIQGVTFLVTDSSGAAVGLNNGEYTTDRNGRISIIGLTPGTTITAKEVKTASGYVLDTTPQSILIKQGEAQTLTFFNTAEGGLELIKVDAADKGKRIANTTFEIRRMDGGLVDTVTTDKTGRVHVDLDAGDYYLVETEAAEGYKLDATPTYFTITDGKTTTVTVTNKAVSGILIHKTDAATGKGLYGVTFLLYDSKNNPVGQYTTDNQGYARIEGIDAGRYQIRELENKGYVPDTELKTVEVKSGETTLIEWKNIPITAQIQITKKSADYNPMNGLAAGTPLEGAVFEIYDKVNNLVDTIQSNNRGLAVSKQLPLGRYTIKEVKAPANYGVNENELTAYLEHEGQIVRFEVSDKSLTTGVNITKTGPKEVMPGQPVRYQFSGIGNTSNVRLDSFYWRDTLPAEIRLDKVVTGTYNFPGTYKITYRVNGGEPRTLADNLSTSKNYTLAASATALGLASNERVTEVMFIFGQAPGGFAQVEAPQIYCTVVSSTTSTSFVNVADVGGVYNGQWVQGVSRWVTTIYKKSTPLPRTGY